MRGFPIDNALNNQIDKSEFYEKNNTNTCSDHFYDRLVRAVVFCRLIILAIKRGREAVVSPRNDHGEQLGGVETCFCPRNHNLKDITDFIFASRAIKEILVVQGPVVLRNYLLEAGHGAGAKKCCGPAPRYYYKELIIRYLQNNIGAGDYEKFAPAPSTGGRKACFRPGMLVVSR